MKKVMLVAGVAGLIAGTAQADVIYDNGGPDGTNGYSNATAGVFGSRRTILDDFSLDGDYKIQDFHWHSVWNSFPAGSGSGAEINIWSDTGGGGPGAVIASANITSYMEVGTGNTFFSRPEAEHWVEFDDISLGAGTYWVEWTVVGPENNFSLTAARNSTQECWVNYDDLGGLMPGSVQFGVEADMAWDITGVAMPVPGVLALIGVAGLAGTRRRRG